ncbi:hypothetical protein BC833DRAFT_600195 [Globomyces pollinis-pini]|nr:hypothetical protein BC833DRAFT_600195 [Globomyces pollinis-pini]
MTTVTDNPQSVENQNFKLVQSIRLYLQNHLKVSCKLSIGSITKKNDPQSSTTLMFFTVDNQLAFAILYSIYLDQDCFYLNIEKVDSTHISIKSLPTNAILGIISYYESILPRLKVHVYAATAKQYLFPKSHLQESKSLKSDRQLISWWIYCLSHPFKYQSNKYWFVPGETSISVSRLLSSNHHDQWKWGLGVDDTSNAHDLFQFPDDLITKTLEYAPEKCTVQELKELMGCMENASGLRALMVLEFQNNTLVTQIF